MRWLIELHEIKRNKPMTRRLEDMGSILFFFSHLSTKTYFRRTKKRKKGKKDKENVIVPNLHAVRFSFSVSGITFFPLDQFFSHFY